ncbi:MAG: hypothetical protein MJE77_10150 [Proteobacteria bacterium]|nr:hypothetical protein [Pseudomonadota bacterium]
MKSAPAKHIAVVICTGDRARVAEALRAAVGLGLRGDAIDVVMDRPARAIVESSDPAIDRAVATLVQLGHRIHRQPAMRSSDLIHRADAIEVWT